MLILIASTSLLGFPTSGFSDFWFCQQNRKLGKQEVRWLGGKVEILNYTAYLSISFSFFICLPLFVATNIQSFLWCRDRYRAFISLIVTDVARARIQRLLQLFYLFTSNRYCGSLTRYAISTWLFILPPLLRIFFDIVPLIRYRY